MTYIGLKELVVSYANRYGVSYEEAINLIKEDLKAVKDDIDTDRAHHIGLFSAYGKAS